MEAKLGVRDLNAGDTIEVTEDKITIGPVIFEFDRPMTERDVEKVITVYAMGSAARCRHVSHAFDVFLSTFEPISIVGFRDTPETGETAVEPKEEEGKPDDTH